LVAAGLKNVEIRARRNARSTFSSREEENVERLPETVADSTFSVLTRALCAAPAPHRPHQPQ
jgi:hypothetical protein